MPRSLLAVVIAVPVILVLGPWIAVRTPWFTGEGRAPAQPVPFDHRHHVQDAGIDCLYCHHEAEHAPAAGVPPASLCMGCHAQIWRNSDALAPIRAAARGGAPVAWKRVHALPDFTFFDHSIHLHADIDCARCHGRVETMSRVRQVEELTMAWCLDCHRDPPGRTQPAPTHCSACHR